jgi:hypothetical protein
MRAVSQPTARVRWTTLAEGLGLKVPTFTAGERGRRDLYWASWGQVLQSSKMHDVAPGSYRTASPVK